MHFEYTPIEPPKALTSAARAVGEKIAKKFFTDPPINIERLIKDHYKLTLRKLEFPDDVSGNASLELNEISVNINKSFVHQRFTLAHELGHIVLNHQLRKWTEYADLHESHPDKPMEEEANAFAAGLLIPSHLLKPLVVVGKKSPRETALMFEVSEQAMWYAYKTYKFEKYLYK